MIGANTLKIAHQRPNDVVQFVDFCGQVNQAARCCTVAVEGFSCEEPNGRLHYRPGDCDNRGWLGLCIDK
jgi:Fungal hydrophobin